MLKRTDTEMTNYLFNVKKHLEKEWDNFLVITGVTGAGKSVFMLQLLESWYKIVLGQEVDEDRLKHITGDIISWCNNLIELEDYDMNIYDEGLLSMDSKDHMSKTQKEVKKIFNTVRSSKKIFNVIIVQDWFSLTKYFREHRANSLIYIYKRGSYKLYTKEGLKYLNGFNERRNIKSMHVAYPFTQTNFPDYKGVLRKPYYDYINKLKIDEMNKSIEIIRGINVKKVSTYDAIKDDVKKLLKQGKNYREIRDKVGVSLGTVTNTISRLKQESRNPN